MSRAHLPPSQDGIASRENSERLRINFRCLYHCFSERKTSSISPFLPTAQGRPPTMPNKTAYACMHACKLSFPLLPHRGPSPISSTFAATAEYTEAGIGHPDLDRDRDQETHRTTRAELSGSESRPAQDALPEINSWQ